MTNNLRGAALLLPFALVGCHQGESEAAQQAKAERYQHMLVATDRASVIFAQQELALAQAQQAAGHPTDPLAVQVASHHIEQAQLQLQWDLDTERVQASFDRWKAYSDALQNVAASQSASASTKGF